ncbi:MAG: hypothetical protein V2I43_11125 [Parvularcula sp.]|jgi:hypothetical protein|nr:hypothetical protein [Parvularcula sp.]
MTSSRPPLALRLLRGTLLFAVAFLFGGLLHEISAGPSAGGLWYGLTPTWLG